MKPDLVTYKAPVGKSIGVYYATMSPDGWCNVFYQPELGEKLTPKECLEFTLMVTNFMRHVRDRDALDVFSAKSGAKLKGGVLPTYGLTYDGMMTYDVHVTGCNVEFFPYRKENE